MAGIADLLISSALQHSTDTPDLAGNLQKGAALGIQVEQTRQARAQLEQKKQEQDLEKFKTVGSWLDTYAKMPEGKAKNAFGNDYIQQGIKALGLDSKISPLIVKQAISDPKFAAFLISTVSDPSSGLDVHSLNDPLQANQMYEKYGKRFGSQEEFSTMIQEMNPQLLEAEKERQKNAAMQQRGQAFATNADTAKDNQSAAAVDRINNNESIKKLTEMGQRIDRDILTLNKHPSVFTLNEVAQSIPSLLGAGSVSSDFKVKEINPHTVEGELAKLKSFLESDPNQPAPAGSVKFFNDILNRLNGAVDRQAVARAKQLGREAQITYKNNPNAVEAVNNVVKSYETRSWRTGEPQYDVGGVFMSEDRARSFITDHANDPVINKDPRYKKLKKELGM